jgi:predicted transcriptional regulator
MAKAKRFRDYLKFRCILLDNNIKDLSEFAKFLGLGRPAVSERFSGKQKWRLEELKFMGKKFNKTLDELDKLLEIPE